MLGSDNAKGVRVGQWCMGDIDLSTLSDLTEGLGQLRRGI